MKLNLINQKLLQQKYRQLKHLNHKTKQTYKPKVQLQAKTNLGKTRTKGGRYGAYIDYRR